MPKATPKSVDLTDEERAKREKDIGHLHHEMIHVLRPYPWDVTQSLSLTAHADVNMFGNYVELIPKQTYSFSDGDNRVHIHYVCIESFSAKDTYVIEFAKSSDGVNFTVIGALRIKNAEKDGSLYLSHSTRPLNNSHSALYGRVKTAKGGHSLTFCLMIGRYKKTEYRVQPSQDTFPHG